MKLLCLILALSSIASASTYNCLNSSSDHTTIASLASVSGATVTLSGTCNGSNGTINLNNPVTINGTATFQGNNSASGYAFTVNSDNVTITGLTFNGGMGAVNYAGSGYIRSGEVFTNNTITHTYQQDNPFSANGLLNGSTITGNTFRYIGGTSAVPIESWSNTSNPCNIPIQRSGYVFVGCTNTAGLPPCQGFSGGANYDYCDPLWGVALQVGGGLNNTVIQFNTFDYCAKDCMYIHMDYMGNDTIQAQLGYPGVTIGNDSVSYNTFTHWHRFALETQGAFPNCNPTGAHCDYGHPWGTNVLYKGNYLHVQWWTYATFGYSIVPSYFDGQEANNTAVFETSYNANGSAFFSRGGEAMETGNHTLLVQGNVLTGNNNPYGSPGTQAWATGFAFGRNDAVQPQGLYTVQNNITCATSLNQNGTSASYTGDNGTYNGTPNAQAAALQQFNYDNPTGGNVSPNTCPGSTAFSPAITPTFINSSTAGTTTTFNFGVVSTLSIRGVAWYVDGSATASGTQEISNVSSTFASDRTWHYGTNLNTNNYTAGSHTLQMIATDVSGFTQSVSTTFSGGGSAAPGVQFSPTTLAFGSSSGTLSTTLTNIGSAPLTFPTAPSITGTNASNWSVGTNGCTGSKAAGATCTIQVVFAGGTGLLSASLSVPTNATGSPQTVSLTGGTQAVTLSPGSLTFPTTTIGQSSATQTITLSNVTGSTITGVAVSIVGTNAADYSQTNNCPSSVVSSATCAIVVTFTPTAAGTRLATVSVANSAAGAPQTANVSGVAPPAGLVSPGLYYICTNGYCLDSGFWVNVGGNNFGEIYSANQTKYQQYILGTDGSYFQVCSSVVPNSGGNPCFQDSGLSGPNYNGTSGVNDTWTVSSSGYIQNVNTGRYIVPPATLGNDVQLLLSGTPFAWTLTAISGSTPLTTSPVQPVATAGQTITITSNAPAVMTITGPGTCTTGCTGSPVTTMTYTAPPSIAATNAVLGCPVLPNDTVFSTRADNLPVNANNTTWLANMTASHIQIQPAWGITYADGSTPTQSWQPFYGNGAPGQSYSTQYVYPWPGRASPSLKREGGAYVGVTGFTNTPDHHTVVVKRSDCTFYDSYDDRVNLETFTCHDGTTTGCNVNSLDTYGWTVSPYAMPYESTDAAGLPLAPLSWNLQEIKSGSINHAIRMTVDAASHFGFTWPATTGAGSVTGAPPYGARLVMKTQANGGPNLTTVCSTNADCLTMMTGLLQYGAFLADAGTNEGIQTFSELSQDPTTRAAMKLITNANIPLSSFYFVNDLALEQTGGHGYTTFQNGSYAADPANGYETVDSSVFVTLTPSIGAVLKVPIALQGTSVGIRETELAIAAGSTYQLSPWVNPSTALQTVIWTCTTCATGSSVTSAGLYTATSANAPAIDILNGLASADGAASITVYMQVLTVASGNKVLIDTGATSPTSDGTNTWNADADISGLSVPGAGCNTTDSHTWGGSLSVQYESGCYAQNDIFYHIVLPPGNYDVVGGFGQIYNGTTFPAGTIPRSLQFQDNPGFLEANGVIGANYYDWNWQTGYLWGSPNTVTIPATVGASGLLEIRAGVNTQDTAITGASGIAPLYNGASAYLAPPNNKLATLQWLQIVPDASSPKITIDSQGASIVSPTQAIQLYAIPWFVAPSAVTWSLISGPGQASVSSTGLVSLSGATIFAGTPIVVQATMGGLSAAITLWSSGTVYLIN